MPATSYSVVAFLGTLVMVIASPIMRLHQRDVIAALPERASDIELKFQPYLDFDRDGCYNTAAIGPDWARNPGLEASGTPDEGCRNPSQLQSSNVYSRSRCNNGICAVMYEYYFEMDRTIGRDFLGGHKHDWENIVVFSRGDKVIHVAPSCHDGYNSGDGVILDGTHPLIVYHKDGSSTHCFRVANSRDQANPENVFGIFYRSPLIGWDSWPSHNMRNRILGTWTNYVRPKLGDEFGDKLSQAAGSKVPDFDPHLEPYLDA